MTPLRRIMAVLAGPCGPSRRGQIATDRRSATDDESQPTDELMIWTYRAGGAVTFNIRGRTSDLVNRGWMSSAKNLTSVQGAPRFSSAAQPLTRPATPRTSSSP